MWNRFIKLGIFITDIQGVSINKDNESEVHMCLQVINELRNKRCTCSFKKPI